jgi:hypothetical protein
MDYNPSNSNASTCNHVNVLLKLNQIDSCNSNHYFCSSISIPSSNNNNSHNNNTSNISNNNSILIDSAATNTMFRQSDINYLQQSTIQSISPHHPSIRFALPNSAIISSIATAQLSLHPTLPNLQVYIFNDQDLDRTLIALADLCNTGCTASFTKTGISIIYNNQEILHAEKDSTSKLWPIQLMPNNNNNCTTTADPFNNNHIDEHQHSLHVAIHHELNADYVQFVHGCFFSPAISTFLHAVSNNWLSNFPRITSIANDSSQLTSFYRNFHGPPQANSCRRSIN